MCVIVHCEKSKPSLADLEKMDRRNPAGAGVAWFGDDKRVHWQKGLWTAKAVHEVVTAVTLPCVIHFRLPTVGGAGRELTHPFPISENGELFEAGSCEGVLFHNGHLSDWELLLSVAGIRREKIKGPVSDTRAIAMIAGKLNDWQFIRKLQGMFAVMRRGKVTRIGSWIEDLKEGIHYSNKHWDWTASTMNDNNGFCNLHNPLPNKPHAEDCPCGSCDRAWEALNPGKTAFASRPGYSKQATIKYAPEPAPEPVKVLTLSPVKVAGIPGHDITAHGTDCKCSLCRNPYDKLCMCVHCCDRRTEMRLLSKEHSTVCLCDPCADRRRWDELVKESKEAKEAQAKMDADLDKQAEAYSAQMNLSEA